MLFLSAVGGPAGAFLWLLAAGLAGAVFIRWLERSSTSRRGLTWWLAVAAPTATLTLVACGMTIGSAGSSSECGEPNTTEENIALALLWMGLATALFGFVWTAVGLAARKPQTRTLVFLMLVDAAVAGGVFLVLFAFKLCWN